MVRRLVSARPSWSCLAFLGLAFVLLGAAPARAQVADPDVFINEIHYDNAGTDAGELVEIAGPAGTDLSTYSIVLYNGTGGAVYDTDALAGTLPDLQNGFGALSFGYPANGIQNGSPDGIALVRNGTEVIQFLSYEGVFTAVGGPANGVASTNIGVEEIADTPVGFSLQLTGTGTSYADFVWTAPAAATPGAVNTGQSFGGTPPTPTLSIDDVSVAEGDTGDREATFRVSLTSPAGPGGVTFDVQTADATATAGIDYDAVFASRTIPEGATSLTVIVPVHGDTDIETDETFLVGLTNVLGADLGDGSGTGTILNDDGSVPPVTNVIINEVDSDTPGTDAAEFIELYDGGVGNTPLDGLVVVLYNGSNDLSYQAFDLDGRATDASGYFVLGNAAVPGVDQVFAGNLLQNGADAVALYTGSAADFPNNTLVTLTSLVDAVVYDTSDADDPGLLVLLNPAEPQVNEDGGTGGLGVDSIQRCPNGAGGPRNTSGFAALLPTPDAANGPCPVPPDPALPRTIPEIQGATGTSPFNGQDVITTGVVTGRKTNGFFLQSLTPDGDPLTSEAVFVFTNTPPQVGAAGGLRLVAKGDVLQVTARVVEFRRTADQRPDTLTELGAPLTVSLLAEGQALPAPLDAAALYAPPAASRGAQLEAYESMLVAAGALTSVSPTNSFGELYAVLAGVPRPFREPGITSGDPLPADAPVPSAIPVFDGNLERIMVETDEQTDDAGVRRPTLVVSTGATVTGAFGPLDYAFDEYRIQVDAIAPLAATGGVAAAVPVPALGEGEFAIGSANLLNFINPAPERFVKASLMIRNVLRTPAILGVIEIGGGTELQRLADAVNADAGTSYQAFLLDADENSTGEQNVGFLVDTARAEVVEGPTQLFKGKTFEFAGVTDTLHDRPPLVLKVNLRRPGSTRTYPVTLMILHLRSLIDVASEAPFGAGQTVGARVREKRRLGAEDVADAIEERQGENLVVLGDLNAFQFNDGLGDIVGTLRGTPAPADQVVESSVDRWDHTLHNLVDTVADPQERYSYVFGGSAQVLDHVLLTSSTLAQFRRLHYARNNADFPAALQTDFTRSEGFSDHDPVIAVFELPAVPTTTTVVSSSNPSFAGAPVTFTASVASDGNVVATGVVEFREGSTLLATAPLDASGHAAFTTSALAIGSHTLTARFTGASGLEASTSSVTQTVVPDTRPRILAFAPPSGTVLTPVLIQGVNFNQVTAVKFGSTATVFVRLTSEYILTLVPLGASTGPISVTAGGTTAVSPASFVVRRR